MTKRKASSKRKTEVLKETDIYSTGFLVVYSKTLWASKNPNTRRLPPIGINGHLWVYSDQKWIESTKGTRWWLQRTSHANACRFKRGNNFPMGRPGRQEVIERWEGMSSPATTLKRTQVTSGWLLSRRLNPDLITNAQHWNPRAIFKSPKVTQIRRSPRLHSEPTVKEGYQRNCSIKFQHGSCCLQTYNQVKRPHLKQVWRLDGSDSSQCFGCGECPICTKDMHVLETGGWWEIDSRKSQGR